MPRDSENDESLLALSSLYERSAGPETSWASSAHNESVLEDSLQSTELRGGPSRDQEAATQELLSRFSDLKFIGRGGMGVVYRAWDGQRGQVVAVKELANVSPDALVRVERELQLQKGLSHRGIVQLLDVFRINTVPFLVLELIEGPNAAEMCKESGGTLPIPIAVKLLREVAAAMAYAGGEGVVHRDIKPRNLLFDLDQARFVLCDFGLARVFGAGTEVQSSAHGKAPVPGATDVTHFGQVLGTPHYLPPEQAKGIGVDQRADIYALGATAFHLLAGEHHVAAPDVRALLDAQANPRIKPLHRLNPRVSLALSMLVGRMLEVDPRHRLPTFEVVQSVLAELTDDGNPAESSEEQLFGQHGMLGVRRYGSTKYADSWIAQEREWLATIRRGSQSDS